MVIALAVTTLGSIQAEAAANKALCVSYSFNGQSYEKDGEKCGYNNYYAITIAGTSKKAALKKVKLGMDVYIPKTALKKENAVININMGLDLTNTKGDYVGYLGSKIVITAKNEQGKIKLYAWDDVAGKNVKASTYASCKAGKGAYKSFYVIKVKNLPLQSKIELAEDKGTETVKASTKYAFNLCAGICGENTKSKGKFYLDNMKAMQGSKTLVNITFSPKPEWYGGFVKGKDLDKKKISIVKF